MAGLCPGRLHVLRLGPWVSLHASLVLYMLPDRYAHAFSRHHCRLQEGRAPKKVVRLMYAQRAAGGFLGGSGAGGGGYP